MKHIGFIEAIIAELVVENLICGEIGDLRYPRDSRLPGQDRTSRIA
jgi:hypothetical protein